jgi:hypothetical protein
MLEDMKARISVPQDRIPEQDFVQQFLESESFDVGCIPPLVCCTVGEQNPLFKRSEC